MQYGDINIDIEEMEQYLGFDPANENVTKHVLPRVNLASTLMAGKEFAVNQHDVDLLHLWHKALNNWGLALQVYRGALCLVHSMLPLPYIKAGWLKISPPGKLLAPHCDWMLLWFVLDHESLYELGFLKIMHYVVSQMEKVDWKSLAHNYSSVVYMQKVAPPICQQGPPCLE
ncbi:unnamed protein product [Sphagnum jensenii]|uniref:Uncharacterized protein n=1 Tax=Sphagnum jensenii TaxID=128206 RepID=A0ABP1C2C5_9BRYO